MLMGIKQTFRSVSYVAIGKERVTLKGKKCLAAIWSQTDHKYFQCLM